MTAKRMGFLLLVVSYLLLHHSCAARQLRVRQLTKIQGKASTDPVDTTLNALDLFGTGVFAFSGAVTAGKKGMDLLGMVIIATITAVGGGTLRDILFDAGPAFWIRLPIYFYSCVTVTLVTFYTWPSLEQKLGWKDSGKTICVADAVGLAAFSVVGAQKGMNMDLPPIMWVVSGVMTATFGGIIRDVLCLQRPRVMYPYRSLYATPPMLGSAVFTVLVQKFNVQIQVATCISFLVTFLSRVGSFYSPLRLPHWSVSDEAAKIAK